MKDLFTDPLFIGAAVAWIAQAILTPLIKRIPPTNVAWVFIRAIHGLFDKIDPPKSLPMIGVLLGLGAALLCEGCSLEAARSRKAAASSFDESVKMAQSKRPVQWCQTVDNWHVGLEVAGVVISPVGAAAGVVAAADTSERIEKIAIGTGLGALAVETLVLAADGKLVSIWTEQGCGQ